MVLPLYPAELISELPYSFLLSLGFFKGPPGVSCARPWPADSLLEVIH